MQIKFDVDFYNFKMLGACHPSFSYEALLAKDKIGTLSVVQYYCSEKNRRQGASFFS